jgi:hypothetical protein
MPGVALTTGQSRLRHRGARHRSSVDTLRATWRIFAAGSPTSHRRERRSYRCKWTANRLLERDDKM